MATLSVGAKCRRALTFLLGLGDAGIASGLTMHGFTQADLDEGWDLLRKAAGDKLAAVKVPKDPARLLQLDGWENTWFPISQATLRRHYPAVHDRVFLNLSQQSGEEVILSTTTFIERVEALAADGEDAQAALDLLDKRGLTGDQIAYAKGLLAGLAEVQPTKVVVPDAEQQAAAEAALWGWFVEWSQIARTALKKKSQLRALGFATGGKSKAPTATDDLLDVIEEEDAEEGGTPSA